MQKLIDYLHQHGIKAVLFDFDDTLVHTDDVYLHYINTLIQDLSTRFNIPYEDLRPLFDQKNRESFELFGPTPHLSWPYVMTRLCETYHLDGEVLEASVNYLAQIHQTVPELVEGAVELLTALQEAGIQIGLVTHATSEWTEFKLTGTGLTPYFQAVHCVRGIKKGSVDWLETMEELQVLPTEVAVIGDSLSGDIYAASKLGTKLLIWINRQDGWNPYGEATLPPHALEVTDLLSIPEKIAHHLPPLR